MTTSIEEELERNLAFLGWLTQRLLQAEAPARRASFVAEYGRALERHFNALEHLVLPTLAAHGMDPAAAEALAAHVALRPHLPDALADEAPGADDDRRARLHEFLALAREHLDREYVLLVPELRRLLSHPEAVALGREVHVQLDTISRPMPLDGGGDGHADDVAAGADLEPRGDAEADAERDAERDAGAGEAAADTGARAR